MRILIVFLIIAGCASFEPHRIPSSVPYQLTWQDYILQNYFDRNGVEKYFSDSLYLGPWQINGDFVMDGPPLQPYQIQEKSFQCPVKKLYPTHPSQATKEYLHAVYSQYDHGRLPPQSYACLRSGPLGRFCVLAAIAMVVVMSDTYEDECGNLYRGYWLVTYLKSDENMGTLFAKGRSAYEKPNAQFPGEFIEDNTYFITPTDFMFMGEILPGDKAKIATERDRALRSGFRMNGKLFVR